MRRRALLPLAALAVFAIFVASCLSPTLPLPPPQVETVATTSDGQWQVSGSCLPGALITVFNTKTAHGVVVEDTANAGFYSAVIPRRDA